LNDKNSPMKIKGMPFSDLDLQYTDILKKFGIDPKNYDTDPYYLIDSISKQLKNLHHKVLYLMYLKVGMIC
jgi:hypothetical protein